MSLPPIYEYVKIQKSNGETKGYKNAMLYYDPAYPNWIFVHDQYGNKHAFLEPISYGLYGKQEVSIQPA